MFFILSKIFYFFIQPLNWIIVFLFLALITKNERKRRRILRGCLFVVVLFTNPFIANRVFFAWEYPMSPMENMRDTFDVGIVLGGYSSSETYANEDRLNFSFAVNRLTDALVLYKKGNIKKILLTGGDGKLLGEAENEAEAVKPFLLQMGVPESDILIEGEARNTHENATFTKKLLEKRGFQGKLLLITSASHMNRSLACFNKIGLKTTPFATHFVANRVQMDTRSLILPDSLNFYKWNSFIKEWIGYVVYYFQGYI